MWFPAVFFSRELGSLILSVLLKSAIDPSLWGLDLSRLFLPSKLNCEVLWDDFAYEVRWAVAGDSIVLQLVARLENNEYMSFGLSGDKRRSQMVGGDVVVAWVDKESLKGFAKDYYLDAKSQCSGSRGSCPDENIETGAGSVRLLNAALVNGYSIVTFQRSLKAQDDFDKDVLTNTSQSIIWAVGPLNSRREVSYHSLTNRGDIFINFGRPPKWNCPTPESISDESEPEDPVVNRDYEEARIQSEKIHDSNLREPRPKSQVLTPAPVPKSAAWDIPPIKCYEPEDGVFYAQMGPTGGKHGYSAITGHVGWGISWYINGLLIPEINVVRGRTYTFIVEGGLDPETPARYHPFYITDDPIGGYQYKTPQERADIQIFAGAVQNKRGEVRPTGVGRLCNWTPDPNAPPADEFNSFGAYQRTLRLECDPGNPGIIQWTVEKDTPNTVYYQCYTHRYLGWKINVHDHCEGEAASHPEPSIIKASAEVIKSSEAYSEGSESIQFEVRVKPDAEILKNVAERGQANFGRNELVNYNKHSHSFTEGSKNGFGIKTPIINHQTSSEIYGHNFKHPKANVILQQALEAPKPSLVLENGFKQFSAGALPSKAPGYSVTEESLEERAQQNFLVKSPVGLQRHQMTIGLQIDHHPRTEERNRIPEQLRSKHMLQEEHLKNLEVMRARAEEKLPKNYHRYSYYNNSMNKLHNGSSRLRKPLPSNPLSLQQRPFTLVVSRPPTFHQKLQKRPVFLNSHKGVHLVQTKSPYFHQSFNIAPGPEDFNMQETQLRQHFKRPNKIEQNPFLGNYNLFGSFKAKESPSANIGFLNNNGFDPQSVQVEGGFKPILNTDVALSLTSRSVDRADKDITKGVDGKVGLVDLVPSKSFSEGESLIKELQKSYKDEKSTGEDEKTKNKGIELFKSQKPQMFEPIFIPSYPDESVKKYLEKYKKKTLLNLKPRHNHSQVYDSKINDQIYIKIKPSVNGAGKTDNAVLPFKPTEQRGGLRVRAQESDNLSQTRLNGSGSFTENSKAENILELLEIYEKENDKTEASAKETKQDFVPEDKFKSNDEIVQDEIAMADNKKDFYLPSQPDRFLSYDGKVVESIEVPTLPKTNLSTDVSRLPQFVPFKGATPSLSLSINVKNLPQLITSKLTRYDILPPPNPHAEAKTSKVPVLSRNKKVQERKKRSADHILGHKVYDRNQHNHHIHSGGSCCIGVTNVSNIVMISFGFMGLQSLIGF